MKLVLARCLDDPQGLVAELRRQGRRGNLLGLAGAGERQALQQAVLGLRWQDRGSPAALAAAGPRTRSGVDRPEPAVDAVLAAVPEPMPIAGDSPVAAALRQLGPAVVLGSGGSSGGRRWCLQPLGHLIASADSCGDWLLAQGIDPSRCLHLNALPLHHVSGLMPLLRADRWGAQLRWLPPPLLRQPEQLAQACPLPSGQPVLLSLVPTQLYRLLACPQAVRWLADCAVIWVGGAALTEDLATRARAAGLPLAPCYGATETAAMVCALPPARFLAGEAGCGPPLADVELRLEGAEQAIAVRSARLSPGWFEQGQLHAIADANGWWRSGDAGGWIGCGAAESVRSEAPSPDRAVERRSGAAWPGVGQAEGAAAGAIGGEASAAAARRGASVASAGPASGPDLVPAALAHPGTAPVAEPGPPAWPAAAAAIRGPGSLIIHGRLDGAIHSGGETVFPEQVRQLLLARIQQAQLPVAQLLLLGAPDLEWGEQLVALVRPQPPDRPSHCAPGEDVEPQAAPSQLLERLADLARSLAPPLRPRRWLLCPELETNATGKWERRRWQAWLERAAPDAPGPRPEERADQDPQNPGAAQSPSDVPPQAPRRRNS